MKFDRFERYNRVQMTARRVAAFARKQQRETQRYPLLVEHVAGEQHSIDVEAARRQLSSDAMEERLRALCSRTWRKARAAYFAASPAVQAAIRQRWLDWTGPRNAINYIYVVDVETGALEARAQEARIHSAAIRAKVRALMGEQSVIDLQA